MNLKTVLLIFLKEPVNIHNNEIKTVIVNTDKIFMISDKKETTNLF